MSKETFVTIHMCIMALTYDGDAVAQDHLVNSSGEERCGDVDKYCLRDAISAILWNLDAGGKQ